MERKLAWMRLDDLGFIAKADACVLDATRPGRPGSEEKTMFEANRLPPPDEMGFFVHPDMPETDDESVIPPLEAIGFECTCVCMEDDAPEDVVNAWFFQEEHTAPLRWTPTTPCGDGWLLAAKYDTEQGPYALFVRPTAAATGSLLR